MILPGFHHFKSSRTVKETLERNIQTPGWFKVNPSPDLVYFLNYFRAECKRATCGCIMKEAVLVFEKVINKIAMLFLLF